MTDDDNIGIPNVAGLGPLINSLVDRINDLEDRVDDLETTERQDRIDAVLTHAERKHRGDTTTVALDYNEVMAAADVSAPTAYSYMDQLAERPGIEIRRGPAEKKRLVIAGNAFNPD